MTKDNGYALIIGGTGFIGRIVVWTLLKLDRKCVVVSRKTRFEEVLGSFEEVWGNEAVRFLTEQIGQKKLVIINGINYSQKENAGTLIGKLSEKVDSEGKIEAVINVAGNTSGNKQEIEVSILRESEFLITFIQKLEKIGVKPKVIHLSSVAAKYSFILEPPYEKAKRISEELLKQSGILDYNVYIGYAKGLGERKMRAAAGEIWPYFSSSFLMCSLKISVVDVERLAVYFWILIEENLLINRKQKECIDVFISNGIISFGEMVRALFPVDQQKTMILPSRKALLSEFGDRIKLWVKGTVLEITKPDDQFSRRIAQFMKLAAGSGVRVFEERYNNLNFFGLKPGKESKKIKIGEETRMVLKKNNLDTPKALFDYKWKLLYILDELTQNNIIRFIAK